MDGKVKGRDFKTCLKGLRTMFRPNRGRVLVSVLIGLVRIAASLGFVWICKALVDIATGVSAAPIGLYVGIMIGIMLVQIAGGIAATYWENLTIVKAQNSMRQDVFSHVLRSSWTGREEFHSADLVNRLEEDARVVVDLLCSRIPDVVITLCQLLAASVFLVSMAPKLLWLLLVLMVIGVFGSKLFFRTLRALTDEIRRRDSDVQKHMQENLQNRVLVLTLIGVERVLGKLSSLMDDIQRLTVRRLNYNAVARGSMSFGFMAGYAAAFLWGVFGIKAGTVTFGMMTAFLQLVGQVQRPIANLSRHIPAFIHSLTSVERLMDLTELPVEEAGAGKRLEEAPAISFGNVCFSYPGQERKVFDNFSYEFKSGSLTVIMGPTGVGKSTLVRLAMGLLKPQSGNVSTYSISNYMYVPQGNSLMSGTIRENLALAGSGVSEEVMRDALHTAAADFVFELPDGLDTVCGEEGTGLSEGQCQRIAIARALLHEGGILILDESTSALDSATEDILMHNITEKYHGKKTILLISHREKVSDFADEILTLKQ